MKLLTVFFGLISLCCSSQDSDTKRMRDIGHCSEKVLIVYLSRTNNTKGIAEIIHKHVGRKLVALELQNPYPENYKAIVEQVAKENETGFLPRLKTEIDSIQKYDVVFVGFPTWGMQLPPPMKSFLKQYDLQGMKIVPFNTNGGYGIGSTFGRLKNYVRTARCWKASPSKAG